jgi:hypothetical protein
MRGLRARLHSHLRPAGARGQGRAGSLANRGTYMYVGFSLDAGGAKDPSIFPAQLELHEHSWLTRHAASFEAVKIRVQ